MTLKCDKTIIYTKISQMQLLMQLMTFQNAVFNPKIKITDNANKTRKSHSEAKDIILLPKIRQKSTLKRDISTIGQLHTKFFSQDANDA